MTCVDLEFTHGECQKTFYVVNMCSITMSKQWVLISKYLIVRYLDTLKFITDAVYYHLSLGAAQVEAVIADLAG